MSDFEIIVRSVVIKVPDPWTSVARLWSGAFLKRNSWATSGGATGAADYNTLAGE